MGMPKSSVSRKPPGKGTPAPQPAAGQAGAGRAGSARTYQLYVRVDRAWSWICTFEAPTHAEAFRHVLACLRADERERPIRLEQDTEGTFCKPCNRGCCRR